MIKIRKACFGRYLEDTDGFATAFNLANVGSELGRSNEGHRVCCVILNNYKRKRNVPKEQPRKIYKTTNILFRYLRHTLQDVLHSMNSQQKIRSA